jgi:hypothetical protein
MSASAADFNDEQPSPMAPTHGDNANRAGDVEEHAPSDEAKAGADVGPKIADLLSDLLNEMKENNRLLRSLGAGRANGDGTFAGTVVTLVQGPETQDQTAFDDPVERLAVMAPTADLRPTRSTGGVKKIARGLVDQLINSVLEFSKSEEPTTRIRQTFFRWLYPFPTTEQTLRQRRTQVLVWFQKPGVEDTMFADSVENFTPVIWKSENRLAFTRFQPQNPFLEEYGHQWPLNPAVCMENDGDIIELRDVLPDLSEADWRPMSGTALCCCVTTGTMTLHAAPNLHVTPGATATLCGSFWLVLP